MNPFAAARLSPSPESLNPSSHAAVRVMNFIDLHSQTHVHHVPLYCDLSRKATVLQRYTEVTPMCVAVSPSRQQNPADHHHCCFCTGHGEVVPPSPLSDLSSYSQLMHLFFSREAWMIPKVDLVLLC